MANQVSSYINENMILAEEYINKEIPLIKFNRPQGTYLAWIDFKTWMDAIDAKSNAEKEAENKGDYMERHLVQKNQYSIGQRISFWYRR